MRLKLVAGLLSFVLITSQCMAASENIQKIPEKDIYVDDIKKFMEDKFDSNLTPEMSEWQTFKTSMEDGWNAFNVNFNVQGGAFTIFEEFLSMSFLKNINEKLGKVGGGLIIGQLAIDLFKGDIKAANTNLAKNSLSYAIGKWGTRGMKAGAIAAMAVEMFLTDFAGTTFEAHDEFIFATLKHYFLHGDGAKTPAQWVSFFEEANQGKGIESRKDIEVLVDQYVSEFWNLDDFYFNISLLKKDAGKPFNRGTSERIWTKQAYFKDYIKSGIVFPYLQSVYRREMNKYHEQMARMVVENMKKLVSEMNRVYTVKGIVQGPKDNVKGLMVHIPGLVDSTTDEKGRFIFKFTLYSLVKSLSPGTGMMIELRVPKKKGYDFIQKTGKLTPKNRETGEIRVVFRLKEEPAAWQEAVRKKLIEDKFFCRRYTVSKSDYARGTQEPSIFWQKNPFKLRNDIIRKTLAEYKLQNEPLDKVFEKLAKISHQVVEKEWAMTGRHRIAYKQAYAERCGNCRIQKKSRPLAPGQISDSNYEIVCFNDRTGQYQMNVDAFNCEGRYRRQSDWKDIGVTDAIVAQVKEHFRLSNLHVLLKEIKEAGCTEKEYREFLEK